MNTLTHRSKLTVFDYSLESNGVRVATRRVGTSTDMFHPYEKLPWHTSRAVGGNFRCLGGMGLFSYFAVIGGMGAATYGENPVPTILFWLCVSFCFWGAWLSSRVLEAGLPYAEGSLVLKSQPSKEKQLQEFLEALQKQKLLCLERKLLIVRDDAGLPDVVRYLLWWKDTGIINMAMLDFLWNQVKPAAPEFNQLQPLSGSNPHQ